MSCAAYYFFKCLFLGARWALLFPLVCITFYDLISCEFTDDQAPTLTCPNVTSTTDDGLNTSSSVMFNPSATDNVDTDVTVNCSHTSDDAFLIEHTMVNCMSRDNAGNSGTCHFVVTVTGNDETFSLFNSNLY